MSAALFWCGKNEGDGPREDSGETPSLPAHPTELSGAWASAIFPAVGTPKGQT